jgi:tetratricopeptide (TPR) repeat protein
VTIGLPVLAVFLLEMGLRIGSYGPDLSLFVTESIAGRPFMRMNPDVKARYFARVDFTPNTSYDIFSRDHFGGTFRIFCLGGSTTVGFPYAYCGSFSSFLRDRLKMLFPERTIEVINLGMTATNSFTVLDIARELAPWKPDLIIVYDGHNEFYGALGSASRESVGQHRWFTLLYLQLVHSRVFLLSRDLFTHLMAPPAVERGSIAAGTMMERLAYGQYVAYGDPTYTRTLETFRDNLEDLATYCADNSIPLVLSTQASNVRHQPPFISGSPVATADTLQAAGWYVRARSADARGVFPEARAAYARARDLDQLRFRTSTDFNNVIRSFNGRGTVTVVDIEQVFAGASPDSIVGNEVILEHLHPNSRGYFLMAVAYAAEMQRRGLLASPADWKRRDTVDSERMMLRSSLTTIDEQAALRRTALLTSGWPFRQGSTPAAVPHGIGSLYAIVDQLVAGKITWEQAHVAAARHFEAVGDTAGMIREYRALINQLPQNVSAWLILAQHLLQWQRVGEAEILLQRSLTIDPGFLAHRTLGGIALQRGAADSAIVHLRKALPLCTNTQEQSETGYLLAVACWRTGQRAEARSTVERVLALNPGFAPARSLLDRLTRSPQ